MRLFETVLELWRTKGNKELKKLKVDIQDNIILLENLEPLIKQKFNLILEENSSLVLMRTLDAINHKLGRMFDHILAGETVAEIMELRRLLTMSAMIASRDKSKIADHLGFFCSELQRIEEDILLLNENVINEREKLERAAGEKTLNLAKIKDELADGITFQKSTIDKIENELTSIDHRSKEKMLTEYLGGTTRFGCPQCKMRFVRVGKEQIQAEPRLHEHSFYCYFCGKIEEADDTRLSELQERWR